MGVTSPLDRVAFLPGHWSGGGTLGDRPIRVDMTAGPVLGHYLQVDVVTREGDTVVHRERIVYHAAGDRLVATTYDDRGEVQRWNVDAPGPGRVELTRVASPAGEPALRWTMELETRDRFRERFWTGPSESELELLVDLRHERRERP